jgi:chemotaxis protein CheX
VVAQYSSNPSFVLTVWLRKLGRMLANDVTFTLTLPASLDLAAAAPLREEFLARRGQKIRVDGANVARVGVPCLQVLLAARQIWVDDHIEWVSGNFSVELVSALGELGIGLERLGLEKEPAK